MAPGSCEETESMLGYSTNIIKTEQVKAALAYIEENNNNNNNQSNDNEKNVNNVRTKDSFVGRNNSVISNQYSSNFKGVFAQCMVAGAVLTLTAGGGMPIGYSAVLLPQLAENNGTLRIDREMGSWIVWMDIQESDGWQGYDEERENIRGQDRPCFDANCDYNRTYSSVDG